MVLYKHTLLTATYKSVENYHTHNVKHTAVEQSSPTKTVYYPNHKIFHAHSLSNFYS